MKLIDNFDNIIPYPDELTYHGIWFGKLLDHHILCLASLFKTQVNPSVTLWTDQSSYQSLLPLQKIFENFKFKIEIGEFNECTNYQLTMFRADKWRLQILQKHGGIYFDMDIVFFKDISWFANYGRPIVHEGYTSEGVFNNAIMYFPKDHPGLAHWLTLIGDGPFSWPRIFEIQKISEDFGADMIPNIVTDLGWTPLGPSCDDFFHKEGLTHAVMKDSFMYHWHNRWTKSVHNENTLVNFYWKQYCDDVFSASS
jgi:hypothetical protein